MRVRSIERWKGLVLIIAGSREVVPVPIRRLGRKPPDHALFGHMRWYCAHVRTFESIRSCSWPWGYMYSIMHVARALSTWLNFDVGI